MTIDRSEYPPQCVFYGHSGLGASALGRGPLVPTRGNQCALILDAHAPCYMEMEGEAPNAEKCLLIHFTRQRYYLLDRFLDQRPEVQRDE